MLTREAQCCMDVKIKHNHQYYFRLEDDGRLEFDYFTDKYDNHIRTIEQAPRWFRSPQSAIFIRNFHIPLQSPNELDRSYILTPGYVYTYYQYYRSLISIFDFVKTPLTNPLKLGFPKSTCRNMKLRQVFYGDRLIDLKYGIPMLLLKIQHHLLSRTQSHQRPVNPFGLTSQHLFIELERLQTARNLDNNLKAAYERVQDDTPFPMIPKRKLYERSFPEIPTKQFGCFTFVSLRHARMFADVDEMHLTKNKIFVMKSGIGISKLDLFAPEESPWYDLPSTCKSPMYPGVLYAGSESEMMQIPHIHKKMMRYAPKTG